MNWQKQEGGEKPKRCEVVKGKESKCCGNKGVVNSSVVLQDHVRGRRENGIAFHDMHVISDLSRSVSGAAAVVKTRPE